MVRYAITAILAAGLGMPLLVQADDHDAKRYYDKEHNDHHEWNAGEEKNFSIYLGEKHIRVHTWDRATPREREEYWRWRHMREEHHEDRR